MYKSALRSLECTRMQETSIVSTFGEEGPGLGVDAATGALASNLLL